LRISFHLKENQLWADKGYEIAFEQLPVIATTVILSEERVETPPAKRASSGLLRSARNDEKITLTGKNFSITFDYKQGSIISLQYEGKERLVSGPVFQGYRAPTDNDKGFGNWLADDWRKNGLDSLKRTVISSEIIEEKATSIKIKTVAESLAENGKFIHDCLWTINGDGSIEMDNHFTPSGELPELPRLGVVMTLSGDLEQLQWYGHGPYENYNDRKTSCPIDVYTSTVTAQYVPYPHPQETGNKEGIRWLNLSDRKGKGLSFTCLSGQMSGSALHFTANDLDVATHAYQLHPRKEVILSLDAIMLGLGNSSCGPGVLKKYAVEKKTYRLKFKINNFNNR
jgi:beta-galactosidase